jgi:hypothetical protein
VLTRCLAADPKQRPTAAELARDLSLETPDARTVVLPATRRHRRRLPLLVALAAVVVLVAGVAAAVLANGGSSPEPAAPPPPRPVAPVPHAATAQQQAVELAAWLRRNSR